jgi:hypothetical protein
MRSYFLLAAILSACSCAAQITKPDVVEECRFLHTANAQPIFNSERSAVSVQLLDDRVVIRDGNINQCEIETSGFPTDLVWLYPFTKNKLIYIEESALGTKLNLADVSKCQILMSRETAAGYRVEDKSVWATCEDDSSCASEPLFQLDKECEIN